MAAPEGGAQATESRAPWQRGGNATGWRARTPTQPPVGRLGRKKLVLRPTTSHSTGLSLHSRLRMIRCPGGAGVARGVTEEGSRKSGGVGIAAEKRNRVNGEIRAERLRLIGEDGSQLGIVSVEEALAEAEQRGFDVVEMSPNADPPVCRLMDYGKFQFQQSKKRQAARRKQQQTQIKEVKFRPGTDFSDYQVKLRNLRRFLDHGHKIKVTLWFRGREMAHQELGLKLLRRIEGDLEDDAKVEQFPKLEGRRLAMVMTPRRPPSARQPRRQTGSQENDVSPGEEGGAGESRPAAEAAHDEAALAN